MKKLNIMRKLLAPAAIALAIGSGSLPARATSFADAVYYQDANNKISLAVRKDGKPNEILEAKGGEIDFRVRTGTIRLCDGVGGPVSDELQISEEFGRVVVAFLSDPVVTGHCSKPLLRNEFDERQCRNSICYVGSYFHLNNNDVYVQSK